MSCGWERALGEQALRTEKNNAKGWRATGKNGKGGAVQVESGTRSTARGWVRPEKASVDTETTPH